MYKRNKNRLPQRSFPDSLKVGAYGERITKQYLKTQPWIKEIIDVRDDLTYQDIDVDFVVKHKDGRNILIEVKTDTKAQDTGNLVYEVLTSKNIGCFEKTAAHYVFYVIPKTRIIYIINTAKMREYIRENKQYMKLRPCGDFAEAYLIPITKLETTPVIKKKVTWVK